MESSRTSVALCTFNGELFLADQLNSILNQTKKVDEIVICDDNSTDITREIISDFKKKHPDVIKVYWNEERLGVIKNFEKAISLTSGDLVFLSDQDDIWLVNKVEFYKQFFKNNKECKLLFSDGQLIDRNNKMIDSTLWNEWLFNIEKRRKWRFNKNAFIDLIDNKNKITGATVCFHKSLKKNILPVEIPEGYWHDAWLGIHASAQDALYFVEKSFINYRLHDHQLVGISKKRSVQTKGTIGKKDFLAKLRMTYPHKRDLIPLESDEITKQNLASELFDKIKKVLRMQFFAA